MTYKQLDGAWEKRFLANTFDDITQLSQTLGKEMFQINCQSHINAMNEMVKLMQNTHALNQSFDAKEIEFDSLEED